MHTQNVNVKTAAQESTERWGNAAHGHEQAEGRHIANSPDEAVLPQMRGLDIRIQFAKAKVMEVIDSNKAKQEMADVLESAYFSGFLDSGAGKQTPPHMFVDEPELLAAWSYGFHSHRT